MLLICSDELKHPPTIKGQVAQKVGHKCWQATVVLMLSTLAHTHTDSQTHTYTHRHTHPPPRVWEEFLAWAGVWQTALSSFESTSVLQEVVDCLQEAAPRSSDTKRESSRYPHFKVSALLPVCFWINCKIPSLFFWTLLMTLALLI